ncbi:MAG: efflux RND transporter permease subunit, partial [Bdellovibrionota bacterium]
MRRVVDESMKDLPKDIEYKILVDPSEFIGAAVANVGKEVGLAAGLAVLILFLFVGSLKNVATAAVEIPLSIVLAFILMRMSGMNLNLISLGGLALSAGMNVDASVVVMENIFRHFEAAHGQQLDFDERAKLVVKAVKEVQFAVIASTIASLVVFVPLAFTSDLTYAILGDLAKAVVFSHGFSAIVALILVPTIRLQLMKTGMFHEKPSFLEGSLKKLEQNYASALGVFLERKRLRQVSYAGLAVILALSIGIIVPRLPQEVIGKPDTDWLDLSINTTTNTLMRQMEATTEAVENELLQKFGDEIQYTFTQIFRANGAFIMFRLKDKSHMKEVMKKVEEAFPNTPDTSYWAGSWNPAELPLPDPPDFKVIVSGAVTSDMADTARDISNELRERKIFERVGVDPRPSPEDTFLIEARTDSWPTLAKGLSIYDLADLTRAATDGRKIGRFPFTNDRGRQDAINVRMQYPKEYLASGEDLGALPIGIGSKIVPLKAFASVRMDRIRGSIERENGRELFTITARGKQDEKKETAESVKKAEQLVRDWPQVVQEIEAKRLAMTGTTREAQSEQVASAA